MRNRKVMKLLVILLILPCVMLFGACKQNKEDQTPLYVTQITQAEDGDYVVTYSNGTTSKIDAKVDVYDLKAEWEKEHEAGESFTEFLMANAHLTLSYNIGVNELKQAWQSDFDNNLTSLTFSEFLASFANLGEGNNITQSINNALFNSVSIACKFTYTSAYNPWTGSGGQEVTSSSLGSGIIYKLDKVNKTAYIITNHHVVYDSRNSFKTSDDIRVCLYGNENFSDTSNSFVQATYVGGSSTYDIAVLKITENSKNANSLFNSNASEVMVEDSNNIHVGDEVLAVGNAQGYGISAVSGIVSVDSEKIILDQATGEVSREFRITAPVNQGNSGGGVFDEKGKLIGIVNAKITVGMVDGIAFAIPSNIAVAVADNIIEHCNGSTITSGLFPKVGLGVKVEESGAYKEPGTNLTIIKQKIAIDEITENSLGSSSNLQVGDIINSVKVKRKATSEVEVYEVYRPHILIDAVLGCFAGGSVEFNVTHKNGTTENILLTITQECLVKIN